MQRGLKKPVKIYVLHKKYSLLSSRHDRVDIVDDGFYGESHHQPPELIMSQSFKVAGISRPEEPAGFNTFIEEQETIAFPKKAFDLSCGMSTEKEQGIGNEKGHLIPFLDDGSKGIYPIAQVGKATDKIDSGKCTGGCILKHNVPP